MHITDDDSSHSLSPRVGSLGTATFLVSVHEELSKYLEADFQKVRLSVRAHRLDFNGLD